MTRYAALASPKYSDVTDRRLHQGGDPVMARHRAARRGGHRAESRTATTIGGVAAVALAIGVARFALTPVAPLSPGWLWPTTSGTSPAPYCA
jgi:hypothetical protein